MPEEEIRKLRMRILKLEQERQRLLEAFDTCPNCRFHPLAIAPDGSGDGFYFGCNVCGWSQLDAEHGKP